MFLGIDLGTTEIKALLLSEDQKIVALERIALSIQRPHNLWSEQAPQNWWKAVCELLDGLADKWPQAMAAVRAIGLSGQMHGAVLIGKQQQVLRPAILWNDGRSGAECIALKARLPELEHLAGNLAMPGFTAPKLLWVQRHEPELFRQLAKVLLPKDYLRYCLSGDMVSDMSDASGTLWLDVKQRSWSEQLLAACDLNTTHMPRLIEGSAASGCLHTSLAKRWGMQGEVIIAGGGGDNAASAVGMGAIQPGSGFVSLGTSGVIFVSGDQYRPNPARAIHAFCHALPERWHQMSVMLSAASCLSWVTRLTGQASEAAALAHLPVMPLLRRENAPLFLPYLSGERTPHNNPYAQGMFFGLNHEHEAADLIYAVAEGVGFGLRDGLQGLRQGQDIKPLTLVGGGARSSIWAQLLSNILDTALITRDGSEAAGAVGAARLAQLASGAALAQACQEFPSQTRFDPAPAQQPVLMARYQRFQQLYTCNAALFHGAETAEQ